MNSFGRQWRVSVFGESHGPCVGVCIDGVPAHLPLCEDDFASDILRRAPLEEGTTARREKDIPRIESGLMDGFTTGEQLKIVFDNEDVRSEDYDQFKAIPRPGHADWAARQKWGDKVDLRGGGQFSGRMTLPIVAAGVVAKKCLPGISFNAELIQMGGSPDKTQWPSLIKAAAADGDSLGGIVECRVSGLRPGLGEPFWDSLESLLSHAVFSIPGVRAVEFGDGFAAASMRGSQHNDPLGPEGPLKNGSGGVNGGLSTGAPIVFRVAFKPTSSISRGQRTWNFEKGCEDTLFVTGRHDICFARRTPVIVEAMAAIVLADISIPTPRV